MMQESDNGQLFAGIPNRDYKHTFDPDQMTLITDQHIDSQLTSVWSTLVHDVASTSLQRKFTSAVKLAVKDGRTKVYKWGASSGRARHIAVSCSDCRCSVIYEYRSSGANPTSRKDRNFALKMVTSFLVKADDDMDDDDPAPSCARLGWSNLGENGRMYEEEEGTAEQEEFDQATAATAGTDDVDGWHVTEENNLSDSDMDENVYVSSNYPSTFNSAPETEDEEMPEA